MPKKILFFITVDHLAPTDLACYANRETQTPCLDALVLDGVVFDEHYAPATFPNASLNAWLTGQSTHLQNEPASTELKPSQTNDLMEAIISKKGHVSKIDYPDNDFPEQLHQFFDAAQMQDRSLCWLRLSTPCNATAFEKATQLDDVISNIQKNIEKYWDASILWLITAEQGQSSKEELSENISALYVTELQQSLSRKLWRPLILSGNFLPEDCPQRIQSLSVAQDIHWTIRDFLDCDIPAGLTFQSLLPILFQPQQQEQQERQLLLLDENQAGLRTSTDLTVLPIDPDEETVSTAQYYVKPEDRNDVNDLNTTAPEDVEKRIVELKELLNKIK